MKKYFSLLLFIVLCTGCSKTTEEKIDNLNGYWEIKEVESPRVGKREFPFSELVDYIQVSENQGVRKKLRPQIGGKFIASEDQEKFRIKVENDSINLYYETPFSQWKETLLVSEDDELQILNPRGIIYTYKRFTPYSSDYGQKN